MGRPADLAAETIEWLHDRETALWYLAVLAYGIGDTVTTAVGVGLRRVAEAGPVVEGLLAGAGLPGFLAFKLVMLGLFYAAWRALSSPGRAAIPFVLAVVGTGVTAWNCAVIAIVVL